jgi:hypothetical protein
VFPASFFFFVVFWFFYRRFLNCKGCIITIVVNGEVGEMLKAAVATCLMYNPVTLPGGTGNPRNTSVRKADLQAEHRTRDFSNVKQLLTSQQHTTLVEEFSSRTHKVNFPAA